MKINGNYSDLWKGIIRPERQDYELYELGPSVFELQGMNYKREDFQLNNKLGLALQCSHYLPVEDERPSEKMPCVIYLHGNCSSRVEGGQAAKVLLPMGMTVFSFDFSGCGRSEGEWVTLGYKEQDDLATVVKYLRMTRRVSVIGLWGRSMGAVTSIFYAAKEPSEIGGMVLDSPFCNLNRLTLELAQHYTRIPDIIAKIIQKFLRKSIISRTGMDIEKLNPIDHVSSCFIPSLFVVATGDDFVKPKHGEDMYKMYAGDKNIIKVEGDHNSARPEFLKTSIGIFFLNTLCGPQAEYFKTQKNPFQQQQQQFKSQADPNKLNILNPVQVQDRHISNEDYLFCLDRTLVEKHLQKSQPPAVVHIDDRSSAADSQNADRSYSSLEEKPDQGSFSSSNTCPEESKDHEPSVVVDNLKSELLKTLKEQNLCCNEDRERMLDKFIVTIASRMEEAWEEQDKENNLNNVTEMLDDEISNINKAVENNISPVKGNRIFENDDEINDREALGEIDCNQ